MIGKIKLILLFTTIYVCTQNGLCLALHLNISPSRIDAMAQSAINMTCSLNSSVDQDVQEVMILELTGQEGIPIALLRQSCDIANGTHSDRSDIQIEGHIDNVPSKSYLRVLLSNPQEEDAGLYQCVMYYLNNIGIIKKKIAPANLTFEHLNINLLLKYFSRKVSKLENEIKNRIDSEHFLEGKLSRLENKLQKQISEQAEKETKFRASISLLENQLKNRVSDLEMLTKENQKKERGLTENVSFLEDKIQNQTYRILDLEIMVNSQRNREAGIRANISSLEEKIRTGISNKRYVSAFSAHRSLKGSENIGDTIVFNDIIMQVGKDYDDNTGLFTVSKPGVYGFHLVAMVSTTNGYLVLGLFVNEILMAECSMASGPYLDQSSVTAFLQLKVKDVVRVKVIGKMNHMGIRTDRNNIFTGYLFQETDAL